MARSRLLERDPHPETGRTPGLHAMDPASPGASRSAPSGLNAIISMEIMRLSRHYHHD
jgi:hypothetical protein